MAKIALITDQHFGARNDTQQMHDYFEKFYSEYFFPTLDYYGIDTIVELGDIFDRRKYVNFNSLDSCRKYFFDEVSKRNIQMHCIVGNHDIYYKNSNKVNSPELLLSDYGFNIYSEACHTNIGGAEILMVPWITAENADETFSLLEHSTAQIVMGHLELTGFEMYKGDVIEHGFSSKYFDKFDIVMSGHYHHKSNRNNIHYLGSPYEMTWSDYNDPRGFHIFDTDTKELEYFQNPFTLFHKIFYDDVAHSDQEILQADYSHMVGSYIKIIIKNKTNPYTFDRFIDIINSKNPASVQVVEANNYLDQIDVDDVTDSAEDSLTSIRKYIQRLSVDNSGAVENLFNSLYYEALSLE